MLALIIGALYAKYLWARGSRWPRCAGSA